MSDPNNPCLFCHIPEERVIERRPLAYAILNIDQTVRGHTLIIPNRHEADFFKLNNDEVLGIFELLNSQQQSLRDADPDIAGFSVGVNNGVVAGQSVFHCHIHLIPRRINDGFGGIGHMVRNSR